MARREEDDRRGPERSSGATLLRFVYGAGLVALGACLGIVIGSLSETPRLLLERLRGPVETVDVSSRTEETQPPEPGPAVLERFGELQEGKPPKPEKTSPAPASPAHEAEPPPPHVAPANLNPPPPVAAAPQAVPEPPAAKVLPEVPAAVQTHSAVVQVASYVERKPADELVVKLEGSGFDAYVSQPVAANGRYRVRIRPTGGESVAELAKRLRGFGFDTWATSE